MRHLGGGQEVLRLRGGRGRGRGGQVGHHPAHVERVKPTQGRQVIASACVRADASRRRIETQTADCRATVTAPEDAPRVLGRPDCASAYVNPAQLSSSVAVAAFADRREGAWIGNLGERRRAADSSEGAAMASCAGSVYGGGSAADGRNVDATNGGGFVAEKAVGGCVDCRDGVLLLLHADGVAGLGQLMDDPSKAAFDHGRSFVARLNPPE